MRIVLLFICLFVSTNLAAQSCGNIFWSQNEIDNFPSDFPGCTEIIGLQFDSDVTNLDSFYNITKISGNVFLNSSNLVDISGLENLDSITGYVIMQEITLIGNLNSVEYIGSDLNITNSSNEGGQIDFPNLQYIAGNLNIYYYPGIIDSFNIFNALDSLDGYINISLENSNLEGFNQLQKVEWMQFNISNNNSNYNIGIQNAFNSLTSTNWISIYGGSGALINNSFSSISTITEYISLDFVSVTNFPFTSLTSTNDLLMRSVRDLQNLSDLNPALNITNALQISSFYALTDLDGLLPDHLSNLNILEIANNNSLSICDYDHICDLLNSPISFTLSGNANGCKDMTQLTNRCTESGTPPINDECANAIEIFYSEPLDCTSGSLYTTNSARMHQETFCVTTFGEEVFFHFTPSESKAYSIMIAEYDKAMGMELYHGSCDEKKILQCGYSEISRYLEADSTYLISVFCDIPTEFTDFKICVGETTLEGDVDGFGVNVASPLQDLHIDGAILIGNTDLDYAGSIRFTGTHFQGFNGFEWVPLDNGGGIVGPIGFQMPGNNEESPSAKMASNAMDEIDKIRDENENLKARLKQVEERLAELLKKIGGN